MENFKRQLTLKDGISLAFGSVIGSGVLFLPSLTVSISGAYTLWVWIITTFLCIPLIYIFSDMVKKIPNESGVEGFISLGLGKKIGSTIPILFLGTVCLGMPSSALIVGEYVKNFFGVGDYLQIITAIAIVLGGLSTNLLGIRIGAAVQLTITFLILVVVLTLLSFSPPSAFGHNALSISSKNLLSIIPGTVVAFWAFAGFENLTFMAGEFKNPARDLKLSMFFALILCGLLYLFLSESCASNIPIRDISPISGLYQLSETISPKIFSTFIITVFAFLAVQINFNSWIWGISRLIYSSAVKNQFPKYFGVLNDKQIPARAVGLLGLLFITVILISILIPNFLKTMLTLVSTNFVFIYALCLISFIVFKKWSLLKGVAIGALILFIILLASSGWQTLYPITLITTSLVINRFFFIRRSHKTDLSYDQV